MMRYQDYLICPVCKQELVFGSDEISCVSCRRVFAQTGTDYYDLLPDQLMTDEGTQWEERQQTMEAWYRQLGTSTEQAISCFSNDYEPFIPVLENLSGMILDLGGGNGVTRHYLPSDVHYIAIDPSLDWQNKQWSALAGAFPCLQTPPAFVRGVGEYLPFRDATFDTVLSFWSLNHVERPQAVLSEITRVLRRDGVFLAVLEDMEPGWPDLFNAQFRRQVLPKLAWGIHEAMFPRRRRWLDRIIRHQNLREMLLVFAEKLRCQWPGQAWEIQDDHIRLQESDIRQWCRPSLKVISRTWTGHYLCYLFSKSAENSAAGAVDAAYEI